MKKDRLEEFVKSHRAEFDNLEPSPQVWEKIQKNPKKSSVVKLNRYWLRIAAAITIGLVSSVILLKTDSYCKPALSALLLVNTRVNPSDSKNENKGQYSE